jgi:hypothetical protein
MRRHAVGGGERHDPYETFRELLAYGALLSFRVGRMPQNCTALLISDEPDILSHLDPVMDGLGFTRPVTTGPCCGLYERHDAAMVCNKVPRDEPETIIAFTLGGNHSGTLRRFMGAIATESSLKVEVSEWEPPLS